MFKQLNNLAGDEIYLIISLLIFVVFFILLGVYLFSLNKDFINKLKQMPLTNSDSHDEEN